MGVARKEGPGQTPKHVLKKYQLVTLTSAKMAAASVLVHSTAADSDRIISVIVWLWLTLQSFPKTIGNMLVQYVTHRSRFSIVTFSSNWKITMIRSHNHILCYRMGDYL